MKDINLFLRKWEVISRRGRRRYLITRGLLAFGLPYLIGWNIFLVLQAGYTAAMYKELGQLTDERIADIVRSIYVQGFVHLLLAVGFGLYMGTWLWKTRTRKYEFFQMATTDRVTSPWHPDFESDPDNSKEPMDEKK